MGWSRVVDPVERMYSVKTLPGDVYLHTHLNGIIILGLAASHPLRTQQHFAPYTVTYHPAFLDYINQASGKRKRGAVSMRPKSVVCTIEAVDGSFRYEICAGIHAKPVEYNALLLENPSLIRTNGDNSGWIGIFIPDAPQKRFSKNKRVKDMKGNYRPALESSDPAEDGPEEEQDAEAKDDGELDE